MRVRTIVTIAHIAVVAALLSTAACGSSSSPTSPNVTVISPSTGSIGASGATITITAAGVSPNAVSVTIGQSVTVINNDNRSHELASNPHPTHGSCPSIEAGLGTLAAGQTRLTQGFAGVGTCGFHDHLNDTNVSFQGTITIK